MKALEAEPRKEALLLGPAPREADADRQGAPPGARVNHASVAKNRSQYAGTSQPAYARRLGAGAPGRRSASEAP